MTNPIVRAQFPAFTIKFEGSVNTMYVDVLGLVTVGNGCLIDTPDGAARLPFVHASGTVAEPSEIRAAWHNVKKNASPKLHWKYAVPLNNGLRLPDAAVVDLMLERLDAHDAQFAKTFPGWADFPPEAQLAIHSMGWAMGSGFPAKWPLFATAVRSQNWPVAADSCKIREVSAGGVPNPGVIPRNKANRALFLAAAHAKANPLPAGITEEDRERVDRMTALWFYEATGEPDAPDNA